MSRDDEGRRYRLEPLDTSGVLFGLGTVQCALLGPAVLLGVLAFSSGVPLVPAVAPVMLGLVACFARVGDHAVWEWMPLAAAWAIGLLRGRRWEAALPLWPGGEEGGSAPPCLKGLEVVELVGGHGEAVGAVRDAIRRTLTVLVRVRAAGFVLEPPADQARLLAGWGDVLHQFHCRRSSPVAHVTWSALTQRGGASVGPDPAQGHG